MRLLTPLLALLSLSTSACLTTKAYVDPQYRKATYEAIQRITPPVPLVLKVEFQRNGQPLPAADAELRGHLERTLRATGVFAVSAQGPGASLAVVANNIADTGTARAKGFGTGLTLGIVGSRVKDDYEFEFVFAMPGAPQSRKTYHHAIHTTVGNASGLDGVAPLSLAEAFGRVVEDVTLNAVKDLQDAGSSRPAG